MATVMLTYIDRVRVVDLMADDLELLVQRVTRGGGTPGPATGGWAMGTPTAGDREYVVLMAGGRELSRHYEPGQLPERDLVAACEALANAEGLLSVAVNGAQIWPEPVLDTTV